MPRQALILAALLSLAACDRPSPSAPHQIHIVGSSAGFPFSSMAAERLMREDVDAIAPLVRAGGTGEGIERFCDGPGRLHPDLVLAARSMTQAETHRCATDGITHVASVPLGFTAFVVVVTKDTPIGGLTRTMLTRALTSSAQNWSAIDPTLPALPIHIVGPAPNPAIADGLFDRLLSPGAPPIRHDGIYLGYGADAERVALSAIAAPGTIGILPYPQAWQHRDLLRMLTLDGVAPNPETILTDRYSASARLILLVKPDEVATTPALPRLLSYYAQAIGQDGVFVAHGLIPLTDPTRAMQVLDAIGKH